LSFVPIQSSSSVCWNKASAPPDEMCRSGPLGRGIALSAMSPATSAASASCSIRIPASLCAASLHRCDAYLLVSNRRPSRLRRGAPRYRAICRLVSAGMEKSSAQSCALAISFACWSATRWRSSPSLASVSFCRLALNLSNSQIIALANELDPETAVGESR
jgi:hypothetical protein